MLKETCNQRIYDIYGEYSFCEEPAIVSVDVTQIMWAEQTPSFCSEHFNDPEWQVWGLENRIMNFKGRIFLSNCLLEKAAN